VILKGVFKLSGQEVKWMGTICLLFWRGYWKLGFQKGVCVFTI